MSLILSLLCFLACNERSKANLGQKGKVKLERELDELSWMLGKWKRQDSDELALWSKKEDCFYGGMKVKLNQDQKAVIQEVLSLEGRKDGIYFSTKSRGRNRDNRSEYKMSNTNFDSPKFVNESLDFPQEIHYLRIGADKIKVEELGTSGRENTYYFVREM